MGMKTITYLFWYGGVHKATAHLPEGNACTSFQVGIVTHELLHNMGMLHTHTRLDRGQHVHVNYLNVLPDKWIDYSWNPLQFPLDTEYDCDSIMHYRDTSFNIGNSITLEVSFLL